MVECLEEDMVPTSKRGEPLHYDRLTLDNEYKHNLCRHLKEEELYLIGNEALELAGQQIDGFDYDLADRYHSAWEQSTQLDSDDKE